MKIIISFLAFFLSTLVFSQEYIPMLQEGNLWNIVSLDGFGGGSTNYSHQINGTTTINGNTYFDISTYGCRLRETDNGKVYAQRDGNTEELLILDFSLEVNDTYTFFISSGEWNPCYAASDPYIEEMTVVSKSIQFIADMDRTVIEFDKGEIWIEGIGSTEAFVPGGKGIDSGAYLSCFTTNGITYYFNDFTECIYLGNESFNIPNIILYPNPVSKNSILQFPKDSAIDSINIYDVTGRLVKKDTISKSYYTIDVMDYAAGLYFYQVLSKNTILKTDRFIVK